MAQSRRRRGARARRGHGCAAVLSSDVIGPRVGRETVRLLGRSWHESGDEVARGGHGRCRRAARVPLVGASGEGAKWPASFLLLFFRFAALKLRA
jgi:hypothetical protein